MSLFSGWFGEKITTFGMWLTLDSKKYRRVHNVILSSKNGTAQIDHILVSVYGIFIIETKNVKGWVFGSERQAKWTQVLYGYKYSFQNPIRQTFRQKKVLAEFLGIDEHLIHTIVYFVGDCEFKTRMPPNVLQNGLDSYVMRFKQHVLSDAEIMRISCMLERTAKSKSLTKRDHLKSLRERHSSTKTCPRCGGNLLKRTAKKGPNTGLEFFGCSNYPKCKFTRNVG